MKSLSNSVDWTFVGLRRKFKRRRKHLLYSRHHTRWRLVRRRRYRRTQDFRVDRRRRGRNVKKVKFKYLFHRRYFTNSNITRSVHRVMGRRGLYSVKIMRNCRLGIRYFRELYLRVLRLCRDGPRFKFMPVIFNWQKTAKKKHRMGCGKGKVQYNVANIYRGEIILEIWDGLTTQQRWSLFKLLRAQIPAPIKFVKRLIR